jgi:SEC-C motif
VLAAVDEAKKQFLFGSSPVAGLDPDDPDDLPGLLEAAAEHELSPGQLAVREVLASQIRDDDPPEAWATAQRLLGLGLCRSDVVGQLSMALATFLTKVVAKKDTPDMSDYLATLAQLPVPTASEMQAALVTVVRGHQGIGADDADRAVLAALGRDDDETEGLVRDLLDRVGERLADDDGPLAWLSDDRTVHVADLTEGIVLTHRLSAAERDLGVLSIGFDLVGFARRHALRLPDGRQIVSISAERGHVAWRGPEEWLATYPEDTLLAVRVDPEGTVDLDPLPATPELDVTLVERLRRVYDAEVAEPELPVAAEDLVLGLQLEDRSTFATPRPPLEELSAAAALERRRHEVAHDDQIWANSVLVYRVGRVMDLLDLPSQRHAAFEALTAAEEEDTEQEQLRAVLSGLRDPDVLDVVTDLLLGPDDDPELLEATERFSERLLEAAQRPGEIAVARWLAAVVAERHGDVVIAEAHVQLAGEADAQWPPAIDRRAWYASDRGNAAEAVRLWRRLDVEDDLNQDLAFVEPYAAPSGPKVGRNEACWCGSGRKYKWCHLGQVPVAPLPDRVRWLYRKAVMYLARRGGASGPDQMELALARAVDPDDEESITEALEDPLIVDVALVEGGWFDEFLADRGPLLPDDEALLAAAWALAPRTIYEVVGTRPGVGLILRDLGTGDQVEVRERSFSRQARPGQVICGRAVTDGETHQIIGPLFPVIPGTETDVLEMCDEGAGVDLCQYVGRQHRPPTLQTREGEPLVVCEADIDLPDPQAARPALDRRYERQDEDEWSEIHDLGEDERILRAQLRLDGARLTVTTHSEARMDRVLAALRADVPGIRVVRDHRRPLDPGELPPQPKMAPQPWGPIDPEVIEQLQDSMERRWLREHIPALGGLSPVEAAADPSRVEQLERLLASFPPMPPGAEFAIMRPERIRAHLGLPGQNPEDTPPS